ncbi:MAG TPA: hypothetical protein VFY90_11440 [Tepidiformaceae bacterium]|nr:hypothetical protein [Tepidiformaceae bacterium]
MADRAFFVGWGNPVRGREKSAMAVFNESVQYWAQLQQDGRIESFEVGLLDPHGGELQGFALLRGSDQQLTALQQTDDFQRSVARASLIVDNLGVVYAALGDALGRQMAMFQQQIAELT